MYNIDLNMLYPEFKIVNVEWDIENHNLILIVACFDPEADIPSHPPSSHTGVPCSQTD